MPRKFLHLYQSIHSSRNSPGIYTLTHTNPYLPPSISVIYKNTSGDTYPFPLVSSPPPPPLHLLHLHHPFPSNLFSCHCWWNYPVKAWSPVMARPRIRACISCVPVKQNNEIPVKPVQAPRQLQ